MAETFLDVVNECLDEIGEPILNAANFAAAVNRQRKMKKIVVRSYKDLQGSAPDEHTQATAQIKLYPPKTLPGGDDVGIELINVVDPSVVDFGGLANLGSAAGYRALGAVGATTCQNVWMQIHTTASNGPWNHAQWYRLRAFGAGTQLTLGVEHLAADAAVGTIFGTPPARITCTFAQYRVPLPADFREPQDLDHPFGSSVDVRPIDVNGLVRKVTEASEIITAEHPRWYAIGYDKNLADGTRLGPFLFFFPFPTDERYYRLLYQRMLGTLTEASAYNTNLDLPDDLVGELIYRSVMRAKVAISKEPEEAGIYGQLAAMQKKQILERPQTAVASSPIQPDMSTRRFYRQGRHGTGPRLFVDE